MAERDKTEILNTGKTGAAQAHNSDDAITRITGKGDVRAGILTVVDGPGKGATLPVFSGQNDISRGDTARVALNFGDTTVSRNTPVLLECDSRANAFTLRDNGHPNPVLVNGVRLQGAASLGDGDMVIIGKTTLRFSIA